MLHFHFAVGFKSIDRKQTEAIAKHVQIIMIISLTLIHNLNFQFIFSLLRRCTYILYLQLLFMLKELVDFADGKIVDGLVSQLGYEIFERWSVVIKVSCYFPILAKHLRHLPLFAPYSFEFRFTSLFHFLFFCCSSSHIQELIQPGPIMLVPLDHPPLD